MSDTDILSPLASDLIRKDPELYQRLVVNAATSIDTLKTFNGITPDQLLAVPVTSPAHAYAMLAGLWLWYDGLTESHEIAQKSPEALRREAREPRSGGSKSSLNTLTVRSGDRDPDREEDDARDAASSLNFWHAIMHRREGDFSNSKYWYAKTGDHLVLQAIGANAGIVLNGMPADKSLLRLLRGGWDPDAFVDLTEAVYEKPHDPRHAAVIALQQIEWRILFDHCTRHAGAK